MSLVFPICDAPRLLSDAEPAVARAARRALATAFEGATPAGLAELLWGLASTDAHEAIEFVLPLLDHPEATVRQLASLCLRSLHPLSALPDLPAHTPADALAPGRDGGPPPIPPGAYMGDWLVPRGPFLAALRRALRAASPRLFESLAELPGEQASIAACVEEVLGPVRAAEHRALAGAARRRRAPVQLIIALTYRCNRKCPYCYAYESADAFGADIDRASAARALAFAAAQRAELISFTGGEPTCHPHFVDLSRDVERRGLGLYLNTNGLFGPEVLSALSAPHVRNIGFHVSQRRLHRPGEIDRIEANMGYLLDRGVSVFVRHTLWSTAGDGDVEWLTDFCSRLGVRHLNLALGFPGRTATNRYIPAEALGDAKPLLSRALDLSAERGIRVRIAKPLPLCLYTRREFARWQRHHDLSSICTVHERGNVHNLVVNPDLGTYPCVGLPIPGPVIDRGPDYAPHEAHCTTVVKRALAVVHESWQPCRGCAMRALGVCQASCLGHCHDREGSS